jgi:glycosyltransferase involved in cell wall biosynthesis
MPVESGDINMRFMVGASNKPFDYLAVGLALVVTRLPEWEEAFVKPGYAVSCDPSDGRSIAAALAPLVADPARGRAMGRAGRARIEADWNYEAQFRPVLERLATRTEGGA